MSSLGPQLSLATLYVEPDQKCPQSNIIPDGTVLAYLAKQLPNWFNVIRTASWENLYITPVTLFAEYDIRSDLSRLQATVACRENTITRRIGPDALKSSGSLILSSSFNGLPIIVTDNGRYINGRELREVVECPNGGIIYIN
jgi:hypothetical protein